MKKRIIMVVICFLLLFSFSNAVWAEDETTPKFIISCEGESVSELLIPQDEKRVLEFKKSGMKDDYAFQWQILASPSESLWVDIYEQTGSTLEVSYALFAEVMDETGSAYIRCKATLKDHVMYSNEVRVTTMFNFSKGEAVSFNASYALAEENIEYNTMPLLDDVMNGITITINYRDWESGAPIYDPYEANILAGTPFSQDVISPTFLGYAPYWNEDIPDIEPPTEGKVEAETPASKLNLTFKAEETQNNIVINVYYKPIKVSYAIKYFFQNVNNDLYTERTDKYVIGYETTGTIMLDEDVALDEQDTVGFTKLYHYPESIAADGSTVFECYYDRNYYLLKFDMNGGYGVDPVYGRYDAAFIVNKPVKPGYKFMGWDLISETIGSKTYNKDNQNPDGTVYEDGKPDDLPSDIPDASQNYRAIWDVVKTTYTVVYWLKDAEGEGRSYLGSEVRGADSDSDAKGGSAEATELILCGKYAHSHVDGCFDCEDVNHSHTDDCYFCGLGIHSHTVGCYTKDTSYTYLPSGDNFTRSIVGSKAQNGYVYKYKPWANQDYFDNYFYVDDKWYFLERAADYKGISFEGELNNPETGKYNIAKATPICGSLEHAHSGECALCGWEEHAHNNDCKLKLRNYIYDSSVLVENGQPIKVMGDGSTVVNVYYTRKIYNLKFYFAKTIKNASGDEEHYIAGGSTWAFATCGSTNIQTMLNSVGSWGRVKNIPELNQRGRDAGFSVLSENIGGVDYHYIEFSAKYGADISTKFPVNMFEPVETYTTNNYGDYAYFSAWNVEHHTRYSTLETNKTLKGNYMSLDSKILYDTKYEDEENIRFLAFWENGATGVGWNKPHEWTYNIYIPTIGDETVDKVYNSTNYKLKASYMIYDNNTDTNPNEQTATALEGFYEKARVASFVKTLNSTYQINAYNIDFYYEREPYDLVFMNLDKIDQEFENVPFGTSLLDYKYTPNLPSKLEENAYTPGGWFTSEKCVPGTEFVFSTMTMPASDLILYAKWTPSVHTVRFFQTYKNMLDYEADNTSEDGLLATEVRNHGDVIGSVIKNPTDKIDKGYDFGGWFYMDKGVKTAFTPLDMPVKKDLNIFAEWSSQTSQPFIIHYALKTQEKDTSIITQLEKVSENMPQDNVRYDITTPAGQDYGYVFLDSDGDGEGTWHRCVSNDTRGFAYQGTTRTFTAKAGDPYNQLYCISKDENYNEGYFPLAASHSITLQYEKNQMVPSENVFTFLYVTAGELEYKVRFVDKNTGKDMATPVTYKTKKSVVTERFAVFKDYVPDAFYKRLVLAVVEGENEDEYVSSPYNEIIFYYTKNDTAAYYAVHYMLQKPGTEGDKYFIDGSGDYEASDFYTEGVADILSVQNVAPLQFTGFSVKEDAITVMDNNESPNTLIDSDGNPHYEITIKESGTELYIFYERNTYNYKVYHLKYGTDITNIKDFTSDTEGVLLLEEKDKNGDVLKGQYGTTVEASTVERPEGDIFKGMRCVSKNLTQTISIKANEEQNYIVFYYEPLQFTVEYKIAGDVGGTLSVTKEVVDEKAFEGSTVTVHTGYQFAGWFLDEECTINVSDSDKAKIEEVEANKKYKLIPIKDKISASDINIFYAKMVPLYGSLKITRSVAVDESYYDQTFTYKVTNLANDSVIYVTITGPGSVEIKSILQGDYTVEQLNDWSWRYADNISVENDDDAIKTVTVPAEGVEVSFGEVARSGFWISGNSDILHIKGGNP